jgi:hypothetical protein
MTKFLEAVAHILAAVAWPAVFVAGALRFEKQIVALAERLREVGGAKFGEPPSQIGAPTAPEISTSAATPEILREIPRTPATLAMIDDLKKAPALSNLTPQQREEALLVLLARVALIAVFQQAELFIWGSQVALLQHLNARADGDSRDTVESTFYEPSVRQFPDLYRNYPFNEWLSFLVRSNLVSVSPADGRIAITEQGREYLAWRVSARRPPTLSG